MQPWAATVLCAGHGFRPRQFEYHPTIPGVLLFGTLRGEVAVVRGVGDPRVRGGGGAVARRWDGDAGLSLSRHDSILGLCWLRRSPRRFICGSSQGVLRMCALGEDDLRARADDDDDGAAGAAASGMSGGGGSGPDRAPAGGAANVAGEYARFEKLTSVHVNCDDRHMLASGYSLNVRLYDVETAQVVREFYDYYYLKNTT